MSNSINQRRKALHRDIVSYVSKSFNLPYNHTHKIINIYINLQGNILLSGSSIYFGDLASIEVTNRHKEEEYIYSTALLGSVISKELNIPVNTTIQIIRKYLSIIKTCAQLGYSTGVKSLFRIMPSSIDENNNRALNINSCIPYFLTKELNNRGIVARVSVKNLRDSLKFSEVNTNEEKDFINSIKDTDEPIDLDSEFDIVMLKSDDFNQLVLTGDSVNAR